MSTTNGKAPAARRRPGVTSEILDRQPPCNVEAEHCVLGSVLIHPDVIDDIAGILRPEDFYDDANALLYRHMLALHDGGEKIDITLLVDALQSKGDYEKIGGPTHLARVTNAVPNAAHAVYYSHIVKQKAQHRSFILATTEAIRDAYETTAEPSELRQRLVEKVEAIDEERCASEPLPAIELARSAVERVERRRRGEHLGTATGLSEFDAQAGGLHPGELIILAARPRIGKTSLACQVGLHQARQQQRVLFVSLEMSASELMTRMLCSEAAVELGRVRSGTIEDTDVELLRTVAEGMQDMALSIVDRSSLSVGDIRTAARRLRRRVGLTLIIVDYLTRLTPRDSHVKRHEQIGQMTGELKRLARELNVPVLVLAQLNREVESTTDNRPKLSHLKDSGDIEQDADVVLFLHRAEVFRPHDVDLRGKAELICAKNRNGPEGSFRLEWLAHTTEFREPLPRNYDPQGHFPEEKF